MTWVATGVILSAAVGGYGISQSEKAKKTAGHAKKYARTRADELAAKSIKDTQTAKAGALTDRRKRAAGVARNTNIFSGSFGGMAEKASKILLGQ